MPQPTVILTPQQIAFYHEQGYLAVEQISTPEELETVRAIYDRLFQQRAGRESGRHFDLAGTDEEGKEAAVPQILGLSEFAPQLKQTLIRANCSAIAAQLCGPECIFRGDHAIYKPPRSSAATPWHQDESYWAADTVYDHALSIWVALQDVNERNGCMQFIPKSHQFEVLPHHSINNDPRIPGLEIDAGMADLSSPAICPLPAGGCTIHTMRTLHYTTPNRTDQPRRAYIVNYHTAPRKLATPRDFYWNRTKKTASQERARAGAGKAKVS